MLQLESELTRADESHFSYILFKPARGRSRLLLFTSLIGDGGGGAPLFLAANSFSEIYILKKSKYHGPPPRPLFLEAVKIRKGNYITVKSILYLLPPTD